MGDGVKVRWSDAKAFDRALAALPPAVAGNAARAALRDVAKPMADTAAELAPDDPTTSPPDLKTRIIVSSSQSRRRRESGKVVVVYGPAADQHPKAMVQEFGGADRPPHPYMRPSWDQHEAGLLGALSERLWKRLARAFTRLANRAAKRR